MDRHGVSVCVSVYNGEKLLPRCLDSLIDQTMDDLEIIVVNDGSTDHTQEVLLSYQARYKERRFVIVEQANKGLSVGRAVGVKNASGRYIAFVDADDYVSSETYKTLYDYMEEKDVDVAEMEAISGEKHLRSQYDGVIESSEYLTSIFLGNPYVWPMLWLRMYRYSLFDGKSPFTDMYCNNEDIFSFPCLIYSARRVGFVKRALYYYATDNDDSIGRGLPSDQSGKYYKNRLTTLYSPGFIEAYIGQGMAEYRSEFDQYRANLIIEFLHTDIYDVTLTQKYRDICDIFGFKDRYEVNRYIVRNSKNGSRYSLAIRVFGVRLSGIVRRMMRRGNL